MLELHGLSKYNFKYRSEGSMHPSGPPRKFFKSNSGPRNNPPGSGFHQDFTVDYDTPPGAFHQSHPSGQPYLPPPPVDGPPHVFTHGPPNVRPQFNPYPPPHYGPYPRPPRHYYPPQQWGQGYGYQRRGGWRGRGRGRHSSGGRGGRYPQSKWKNEGGDNQSSSNVDAYYSTTMFEDPWKDLLPKREAGEATTSVDATKGDCEMNLNVEQDTISSELGNTTPDIGVDDQSAISPNMDGSLIGSSEDTSTVQSSVKPSETSSLADSDSCQKCSDVPMVDCADEIETEKT